ncbi:MAG: hypothetical protein MHM6MM_004183, partial [Cercozoa sp. M6MM]
PQCQRRQLRQPRHDDGRCLLPRRCGHCHCHCRCHQRVLCWCTRFIDQREQQQQQRQQRQRQQQQQQQQHQELKLRTQGDALKYCEVSVGLVDLGLPYATGTSARPLLCRVVVVWLPCMSRHFCRCLQS